MQYKKADFISPYILAGLPQSSPVLLAFSGGADSSALLHMLVSDSKEHGYPLFAAHLNHKIRGADALRDLEFCRKRAAEYGIPFFESEADVPALAKQNGTSLEQEAREQRYAFLAKTMKENGIPILVTAHHADDAIESMLLHLLRGSGISGLCGISPSRPFGDGAFLVRPMLMLEKSDVLAFCRENGITFVEDSTNTDTSYQRNAIRAHVTPELKRIQPELATIVSRTGDALRSADDFLTASAREYLESDCKDEKIPLSSFNTLHPAKKARVLSLFFAKKSQKMLEYVHIDALIALCEKATPHAALSLPDRLRAQIEDKKLIILPDREEIEYTDFRIPFSEGRISLFDGAVTVSVEKLACDGRKPEKNELILAARGEDIKERLFFRNRRQGDTIRACNMSKSVKKLLCDKKVPLDTRDKLPILCSDKEILWIPLVCECDSIKKGKINEKDEVFFIRIEFNQENHANAPLCALAFGGNR